MDYGGAVQYSLAAALDALQAQASGSLFSAGLVFGLVGLAVGVAIGVLVGFFFFKKRKTQPRLIQSLSNFVSNQFDGTCSDEMVTAIDGQKPV